MKLWWLGGGLGFMVLAGVLWWLRPTVDIVIRGYNYTPITLTIPAGTTVRWISQDDSVAHTMRLVDGTWTSDVLEQNDQARYHFAVPGIYPYLCDIYPDMRGTVIVTARE